MRGLLKLQHCKAPLTKVRGGMGRNSEAEHCGLSKHTAGLSAWSFWHWLSYLSLWEDLILPFSLLYIIWKLKSQKRLPWAMHASDGPMWINSPLSPDISSDTSTGRETKPMANQWHSTTAISFRVGNASPLRGSWGKKRFQKDLTLVFWAEPLAQITVCIKPSCK